MASLPLAKLLWRLVGGADDSWTEVSGIATFSPPDGADIEVKTVAPSKSATIRADTTITGGSISNVEAPFGTAISVNAAAAFTGTNIVYSLSSAPSFLSINPTTGLITGTAPDVGSVTSVIVHAQNSKYSADASFSVKISDPLDAYSVKFDFKNNRYFVGAVEKTFSDLFTTARNSIGTYFDIDGNIQTAAANTPRFTYDPITHEPRGLLIEGQRRNEFLNSDVGATQSFTTVAGTYTLSFYGTGTITLSGAATGVLVGTAAFPVRSTLTFTSTAASLTMTVTGSCSFVQLEAGTEASSYIPNTSTRTTRLTDNISNSASNTVPLSSWYNAVGGTFTAKYIPRTKSNIQRNILALSDGTVNNRILLNTFTTPNVIGGGVRVVSGGVSQYLSVDIGTETLNTLNAEAFSFGVNNFQVCTNGALAEPYTAASALPVSPTILQLGVSVAGNSEALNGVLSEISFYPVILSKPSMIRATSDKEIMTGFGDSITAGYNATTIANRWVNLVAAAKGYAPINAGISSTTLQNTAYTTTGLPGINNGRDRYQAYLTGVNKGKHVYILYGVNDIRLGNTTQPSLTPALYQNDLGEIVDGLLAAGYLASDIVIGSPPFFINGDEPVRHAAIANAARQVAVDKHVKFADVYNYMLNNGGTSLVSGDDLHPNDAGMAAIATAMIAADYV